MKDHSPGVNVYIYISYLILILHFVQDEIVNIYSKTVILQSPWWMGRRVLAVKAIYAIITYRALQVAPLL